MQVGSTGYVKGNATALQNVIELSSAEAKKDAGTWLSFSTSTSAVAELVSGLLNSQVSTELQMSGPYTYGAATTVQGQHVVAVRGSVSTQSGSKVPVVLYIPASGRPVPLEEVTNPGKTGGSTAIHGTVVFTNWGEKTTVPAPGSSVSLLKLVPASTSGATTHRGVGRLSLRLEAVQGDITTERVDAVVNAANRHLPSGWRGRRRHPPRRGCRGVAEPPAAPSVAARPARPW